MSWLARIRSGDEPGAKIASNAERGAIGANDTIGTWFDAAGRQQSALLALSAPGVEETALIRSQHLPSPADIAERAAIIGEAEWVDDVAASHDALAAAGFDSFAALGDRHRQAFLADLASAQPLEPNGGKLDAVTRGFLGSQHFLRAVSEGWDMLELFGVNSSRPLARFEGMGIVVMVAFSRLGLRLADLDRGAAVFVSDTGALQTFPRFRHDLSSRIPWWECPALATTRAIRH